MSEAALSTRFDDLNWARLNLISAQDHVAGQHRWQVQFVQGDRVVNVSCRALPELGVPHGVDNDVSAALIDHFMSVGLPEDGLMDIPAVALLRLAGFHRNGRYWAMLRESLDRLNTTSYKVTGGWRDHPNRRWTTAQFHFIESLEHTHQGERGAFDERSMLRVRLAAPLVESLRGGYTKPLNIEFMQSLSRPRTRILFRVLDAMRYNPERPDETIDAFDVGLLEWADQCKIPNARPDSVRRALEGPHEELLRRGYLGAVEYTGRGSKQRLRYEYAPEFTPVSPAVLARLRRHGVADGVSRQLARQHSSAVLMARMDLFERLVRDGLLRVRKTTAHALVHLIKNPDQYVTAPATITAAGTTAGGALPARRAPRTLDEPDAGPTLEAELAPLDVEARAEFALKRLGLLYHGKLRPAELDVLRHRLLTGDVDAAGLLHEAYARLARMDGQGFLDELRAALRQ